VWLVGAVKRVFVQPLFELLPTCGRALWLQRKNDDDKKNRADDTRLSQCRQIPVKQVVLIYLSI